MLGKVRLEQPRNLRNALAVRLDNAVRPHANALHPWEPFFTLFVPFPVCVRVWCDWAQREKRRKHKQLSPSHKRVSLSLHTQKTQRRKRMTLRVHVRALVKERKWATG